MSIQMYEEDFCALLKRLSVPFAVEQINDSIMHIKMWHNGQVFRARFVDAGSWYEFTNFLEG